MKDLAKRPLKLFSVYIITNYNNSVLYTGITNNIERRLYEHKNGIIKYSFSHKYRLHKLVWYETFPHPEEAIKIEKKIKGWTRKKKMALIQKKNPSMQHLSLC